MQPEPPRARDGRDRERRRPGGRRGRRRGCAVFSSATRRVPRAVHVRLVQRRVEARAAVKSPPLPRRRGTAPRPTPPPAPDSSAARCAPSPTMHLVAAARVELERDLVRPSSRSARRARPPCRAARRRARLEPVHGRVLAVHVVADLGARHRLAHRAASDGSPCRSGGRWASRARTLPQGAAIFRSRKLALAPTW